jgi:hypothetical protein
VSDDRKFTVEMEADEALVLFEFLARRKEIQKELLPLLPGEDVVLDGLLAQLESMLVEPFDSDYGQVLSRARDRLQKKE